MAENDNYVRPPKSLIYYGSKFRQSLYLYAVVGGFETTDV